MVCVPVKNLISSLALVLLIASVAAAQAPTTGRLTGTVTDQQGGVVPRALILAKNAETGSEFRAVSNGVGVWVISSVPSGNYTISVTVHGFRTANFKGINVTTGSTATVDATLQIGLADTVVVTASKIEEDVINAPATVSVIPESVIRDSPFQNLADLLRIVPGINVVKVSADSFGVASRTASGALAGNQLALVDGRTIYDDALGGVFWTLAPTSSEEVKQLEVIRGPASAIWGSYALNGVVNMITKPPREMLGTTFTLGIGTFNRSGGLADSNIGSLYYARATHAQALNDRWAFKISGGAYTQDAFARPRGPSGAPYPTFKNEGTTQPRVDGRVDYDPPDGKQHFTFAGGSISSKGIAPGALGGLESKYRVNYGKVDYVRGSMRITGYVNTATDKAFFLFAVSPTGQMLRWDGNEQTYHVEFGDSRMVQAKHLINYGGSFRQAEFNFSWAPDARKRSEGGAYLQDEILLSRHFRWIIGARIDKFENLKGVVVSPRTTFMLKPAPSQTFRFSYNRAYVAPSIYFTNINLLVMSGIDLGLLDSQLAGNYFSFPMRWSGNKNMQEQSLNAYEIGYTAVVARNRVSFGAVFYVNDSKGDFTFLQSSSYTSQNPPPGWPLPPYVLDALIAANAFGPGMGLPSLITTGNRGKVRNKGLELNADARFNRYLTGYANYSWQARPESKDFEVSAFNLPPTHRFNAGMGFDYKRFLGNVSVSYVGSAYWNDVNVIYGGFTKAYTEVYVSGGVRWGGGGKYMTMLKVSNLANTRIQNHLYGDILKRQIIGEFRVRL